MKRIYHLTLMQKLYLIPLKLIWLIYPNKNKKTWHEVKKGMENHRHRYTLLFQREGKFYFLCEHEGCCDYVDANMKNYG